MAIRSGFFQSIGGDRVYRSEFFASYFASFIGNGVFPNPSSNLQVVAGGGLSVNVQPGKGWINGYYLVNDSVFNLPLLQADGVLSRIDRIIMSLDFNAREMSIAVKQGAPSGNPIAPALTRNSGLIELALADVRVSAGTTTISQANITDTRLNGQLCGIVSGLVNQVDTTTLFIQYQEEFEQFLEDLQDVLSGDIAGNLFNLITDLDNRLTEHEAQRASVTNYGHVRLNNNINSTSVNEAATPNAVKQAYDRAEAAFQSASNGKQLLSVAIAGKGQTVSPTAPFSDFATAINNISTGVRVAMGSVVITRQNLTFAYYNDTAAIQQHNLVVDGLDFRPSKIIALNSTATENNMVVYNMNISGLVESVVVTRFNFANSSLQSNHFKANVLNSYVNNTGFRIPAAIASSDLVYDWVAYE